MNDALFQAIRLGDVTLPNRIAMAPMTRECAKDGVPSDAMRAYYRRRAAGGTGLIITEGSPPNLAGSFGTTVPRFYGDDALAGWQAVAAAVHEEGAAIFAQLWHVGAFDPSLIGMQDSFDETPERLSPSGLATAEMPYGRALTESEIGDTIDAFATAAGNAMRIGFDGVEIHGAHGYLPDQFFWADTNRRDDDWGGGLAERTRFAAELIRAIRARCGGGFPVSFRFSQWKQLNYGARVCGTPAELEQWLSPLADAGATLLHCSTRRFWEPAFDGSQRTLAAWARHLTGLPVIAVGSVTLGTDFKASTGKVHAEPAPEQVADVNAAIERGDFDIIAIGRALLANPDWASIVASGELARLRSFDKSMIDELI